MKGFISKFLKDESGAAAAEYALILAVITAGIATIAVALGGEVIEAFTDAEADLATANSTAPVID